MSEGLFLCEYCGYSSDNQERCSQCGRHIANQFTHPAGFSIPRQGRLTLRRSSPAGAEHIWKEVAELWNRLERETNLRSMVPNWI